MSDQKQSVPTTQALAPQPQQPVQTLTFKGEELNQLDALLGQIPIQHGLNLVDFIRAIRRKRDIEAQIAGQAEKKTDVTDVNPRKIKSKTAVVQPLSEEQVQ